MKGDLKMGNLIQKSNLEIVLDKIRTEILSGVKHGFFDYQITCEVTKDKKRKVTVKTGKSYQFYIPDNEV